MNLQFDLQYLRALPEFRFSLEDQLLIDLSVLNYLHDETRPEKSLKSLGPVLRTHSYSETLKDKKFFCPHSVALSDYNAQDTHNTMLAIAELSRRILRDFPETNKITDWSLNFYSNTIWSCIRMSEAGIPINIGNLESFEATLIRRVNRCNRVADKKYGLYLEGPGSGKSKERFINLVCDVIDGARTCTTADEIRTHMTQPEDFFSLDGSLQDSGSSSQSLDNSIRDNPLLQITPKQGIISFSEENRNLLCDALPPGHILRKVFRHAKRHASSQKLISSYCYPLLRHRRNRPSDKSSVVIPRKGSGVGLAYPTWYCVPTFAKDSGGSEGGTLQGRITCKKPSAQTFPHSIKRCIESRFKGGTIMGFDLSQIELRVAALLSGDPSLMSAYLDGADLHRERADQIFGDISGRPDYNDLRQAGKMINFADLFRSGANTMQGQLLAMTGQLHPLEFFKEVARNRPKHRPGLWKWQNYVIQKVRSQGYFSLPFTGQSRYFQGGDKWDVNEIVNFPVQTTAGNTLLCIQHELHHNLLPSLNARSPKIFMFLNIYDAFYLDVAPGEEEVAKRSVAAAVRSVAERGYWADLQEYYGREIPLEYDCEA